MLYLYFPILLLFGLLLVYKGKRFYKKNETVFQQLDAFDSDSIVYFSRVWTCFSVIKLARSYQYKKIYFIRNAIIFIDDYSLDMNINSDKYAETHIIFKKNSEPKIDKNLFRNYGYIENLTVSQNGEVKINSGIFKQSLWEKIGFYPNDISTKITFTLPIQDSEIKEKLRQMGII